MQSTLTNSDNPPFSLVMPVKDEAHLLRRSLPACYALHPNEIVLCFDKPAAANCLAVVESLAPEFPDTATKILEVERNPDWKFHQAWVRRSGFKEASHQRILTVDADLIVNRNVLKAVQIVGKDNIGLVSLSKFYPIRNAASFVRAGAYHIFRKFRPAPFTGLYWIWRPAWLGSEDDGIRLLQDPRKRVAHGSMAAIGEDTYLRNCMIRKHRVKYLREIGAYCITRYVEDVPHVQYEVGRYLASTGERLLPIFLRALIYLRPYILSGYLNQRRRMEDIPIVDPHTFSYGAPPAKKFKAFWESNTPMAFRDKPMPFQRKRAFRYQLQDYMQEVIPFGNFRGKLVLEVGSGSGIDACEFGRNGARVVATDFSSSAIQETKAAMRQNGIDGDVVLASAEYLPFKRRVFDLTFAFGVIHHIINDARVVQQFAGVLRRNGSAVAMLYNRNSLLYAYSILFQHGIKQGLLAEGLSENEVLARFSERVEGCPYTRAYTTEEARELFTRFFHDVQISTHYNAIDLPSIRKAKFQLHNSSSDLGWHLIVKASHNRLNSKAKSSG